jgi:serine/threonine protein kinase
VRSGEGEHANRFVSNRQQLVNRDVEVPIIENGEYGEYGDFWALVMPRAEMSLREYIDSSGDRLNLMETIVVLKDVCDALADLEASVVHRDLKPHLSLAHSRKLGPAPYAESA